MEVMDLYRAEVARVPVGSDSEFGERLRRYRGGDDEAGRAITGGYLGMVLALVESLPELPAGLTLLEAVQEGNAGLAEALDTFSGTNSAEFESHARQRIHAWLDTLDQR